MPRRYFSFPWRWPCAFDRVAAGRISRPRYPDGSKIEKATTGLDKKQVKLRILCRQPEKESRGAKWKGEQ
jgi:hypothetical protein